MPSGASSSAAAVSQLGRCPRTRSAMTGASTDETATMNAERDGVVITRPAVWVMKPNATSAPSSSPPRSSRPVGRGETGVSGASSSAATPNRTVRKANGVAWANALFTATKLVPQRKVASSSARSAWRRVTPSAGLVQHFAYLARQPVGREGLLEEGGPRVEHAVLRDRFVGVPGHVQHTRVRTQRRQPVRAHAPRTAGGVERRVDARQVDAECGTPTRGAVHSDVAPALTHDAVHGREAEPGALTPRLGREERLEQMRPDLVAHADARIRDAEQHVAPDRAGGRGRVSRPAHEAIGPP